jgi:hypothetical protein
MHGVTVCGSRESPVSRDTLVNDGIPIAPRFDLDTAAAFIFGASLSPKKPVLARCWHLAQARLGLASTPHQPCPTLPERLSVSIPLALPSSVPSSVETSLPPRCTSQHLMRTT